MRSPAGVLLIWLTAVLPAGCGTWTTTDNSPSSPGPVIGDAPAYGEIPDGCDRLTSGSGSLRVRAPGAGRIWIGDDSRRYVICSHAVKPNDKIEIDPKGDRIEINDQPVFTQNLESNDQHTVYFRPSRSLGRGDVYGDIPRQAERVAGGTGSLLYRAEYDGRLWVGDDKAKRVIVSQTVRRGDAVEIDIKHDQVKINGKIVFNQNLESKHQHSIYMQ